MMIWTTNTFMYMYIYVLKFLIASIRMGFVGIEIRFLATQARTHASVSVRLNSIESRALCIVYKNIKLKHINNNMLCLEDLCWRFVCSERKLFELIL